MITLTRAVQTCIACPSQWDAWDAAGNYYYLRFRGGHGQMRQYATENWVDADTDEYVATVADFAHGHPLDGFITLQEFAVLAGIALAEDIALEGFGDHIRDGMILSGLAEQDFPAWLAEAIVKWNGASG